MIPVAFDYVRPSTVDEALTALRDAGDEAKVLAGGQSLVPVLRLRMAAPGLLVDLGTRLADILKKHQAVLDSRATSSVTADFAAISRSVCDAYARHVVGF